MTPCMESGDRVAKQGAEAGDAREANLALTTGVAEAWSNVALSWHDPPPEGRAQFWDRGPRKAQRKRERRATTGPTDIVAEHIQHHGSLRGKRESFNDAFPDAPIHRR